MSDIWSPKETAVISQLLKELLSVNFGGFVIPESICNEIAQYSNSEFEYKLTNLQHQCERLIFPAQLVKYTMYNPFGFSIFASITSDNDDTVDGFDGVLLDIEDVLTIRFFEDDDGEWRLSVNILSRELLLYVNGYEMNTEYILAFSFLKLENYKYIIMIRDLNEYLEFKRKNPKENDEENDSDSDEDNDEDDDDDDNDYEDGVFEYDVKHYFNDVITDETDLIIGNNVDNDYFDAKIGFISIKIGICDKV